MQPNENVIEHAETSFTPMELEAIAKVSRTVSQLNEVLREDGSEMDIDWSAMIGHNSLAGRDVQTGKLVVFG